MTQVMKKTGCTCFLHNTLKFCIVSEILYTIVIKNERLSFILHLSSCHIDSVVKEINMKIKNFRLLRGLLSISMILFFLFDYWYERLSVMLIFEYLILLDIKIKTSKSEISL